MIQDSNFLYQSTPKTSAVESLYASNDPWYCEKTVLPHLPSDSSTGLTVTFSVEEMLYEYGKRLCRDAASMEVTSNLQSAQLLYTRALCLFTLVLETALQEVSCLVFFIISIVLSLFIWNVWIPYVFESNFIPRLIAGRLSVCRPWRNVDCRESLMNSALPSSPLINSRRFVNKCWWLLYKIS